jgi:D-alanine-D-alanine ligase-like ATP-grasp enzyme
MKLLIINNPLPDRKHLADRRFAKLTAILLDAGIYAKHIQVQTICELDKVLNEENPDIVYSADYYLSNEENNQVAAISLLEERSMPYIGSSRETLELVLSKGRLKEKWLECGIATPSFFCITKENTGTVMDLVSRSSEFPYILKPNREGNSRGLDENSIVYDLPSLERRIEELLPIYKEILVEWFFGDLPDLREFTVAVIGNNEQMLFMPAEIILKTPKIHRLITTMDKDHHHTQALPVADEILREKLMQFASQAMSISGIRDYSRIDLLMTNGQLFAIEINGLPMIPDKWFEVCAAGAGFVEQQYIVAIMIAGVVRSLEMNGSHILLTERTIRSLPASFWRTICEKKN